MKTIFKIIYAAVVLLFVVCLPNSANGQENTPAILSPNGLLDDVFDHYGNHYTLNDLKVGADIKIPTGATNKSMMLCNSGIFNLYFETGSGMENATDAVHIARRNLVCQVFSDISDFINTPLKNTGNTNRVNIWVRDINQTLGATAANPNPAGTSGSLGLATAYYNLPRKNAANFGGIADNEVWKTIHTGKDSYINTVSPLISQNINSNPSGSFYHGMMAFNFSNPNFNWNTNLGVNASGGLLDLYTVVLHEVTHALGFTSLINSNGISKCGTNCNYYSRYDRFLKNNTTTNVLITNTGSCEMYNYGFNTALNTNILQPNCPSVPPPTPANHTDCGSAIQYVGGVTVPVYTPTCFEPPSSLSHFEDECYGTAGNNLYFTMSESNGPNVTKRFLQTEERQALCDIGYSLNTTFGNTARLNFKNYGSTAVCGGITVAGTNDGINANGTYAFTGLSGANITITNLLANDYTTNAADLRFECLEDVYDANATLSITTGNNATTVTLVSSVVGVHLLRYVPFNNITGQRGNITYLYAYVRSPNCTPSVCNLVNNSGFELATDCGEFTSSTLNCWDVLASSPNLFIRGCTSFFGLANTGFSTYGSNPASDSPTGTPNNNFIGILSNQASGYYYSEAVQTTLSSPLVPGENYILSFKAKVNNDWSNAGTSNHPTSIGFASLPTTLAPITINNTFTSIVTNAVNITSTTIPAVTSSSLTASGDWHSYNIPFTATNTVNHNTIAVYCQRDGTIFGDFYIFIDDIAIKPRPTGILNLLNIVCANTVLTDLDSYLSPAPAGGVFSGVGILGAVGTYSFSATTAGIGVHNITYTYTNNLGCLVTIADEITVVAGTITAAITGGTNTVCPNQNVTLTASGGVSYRWNNNETTAVIIVAPSVTTTYTVTVTNAGGCTATATRTVTVNTVTPSISGQTNFCGTSVSATLQASGGIGYLWSNGTPSQYLNTGSAGIYTVTVTGSTGCTATQSVTVTVNPLPTPTITGTSHLRRAKYNAYRKFHNRYSTIYLCLEY